VRWLTRVVLVPAVAATLVGQALLGGTARAAVTPHQLFMQVVAHEDDDLFFMNPDVSNTISAGAPSVTVFMTAGQITGDGSTPEQRARNRQRGAQNAYASMAGLADADDSTQLEWNGTTWSAGGKTVERYTLRARPTIQLVFLDLPDGQLGSLRVGTVSNTIVPEGGSTSASQQYTPGDAVAVLRAIMSAVQPTVLRAQDAEPDRRYSPDHADHVAAAQFARDAAAGDTNPLYEVNYRDYNIADVPINLDAPAVQSKRDFLAKYARYDSAVAANLADSASSESAWAQRMYYRWSRGTQWTGRNQDGRAQAFVVRNGAAYTYSQTPSGQWTGPLRLADPGGRLAPGISVGRNPDGRLEIFAHRLSDQHIVALPQATPNGSFRNGPWEDLGNPNQGLGNEDNVGTPTVAANGDGRLEVFVKNGGGGISTVYRTTSGDWNGSWVDMNGTDVQDGLTAVTNPLGNIELFASTRQTILHWYQHVPNSSLLPDTAFPAGTPASPPSAALDQQGAIDLLYRQPSTAHLMQVNQTAAAGGWASTPVDAGGQGGIGQPATVTAPPGSDARIMLFTRNRTTGVSTTRQISPNEGYGPWTNLLGFFLDHPSAVMGMNGEAIVFTIGTDGVYAIRQVAPGGDQPFGAWEPLGM
jgi:LmbE family N-acetylglucosaminyl deacetylase